jgi:hypothetical protein
VGGINNHPIYERFIMKKLLSLVMVAGLLIGSLSHTMSLCTAEAENQSKNYYEQAYKDGRLVYAQEARKWQNRFAACVACPVIMTSILTGFALINGACTNLDDMLALIGAGALLSIYGIALSCLLEDGD